MIGQRKNMPPKYLSNLQLFKTRKRPLTTFSSTVSQNFSDEICQTPLSYQESFSKTVFFFRFGERQSSSNKVVSKHFFDQKLVISTFDPLVYP